MPEEEDLIQRVSELHTNKSTGTTGSGIFLKSGSSSKSRNCDQDFLQLCTLVKEKLNREGISLAAPPFTTKVRPSHSIKAAAVSIILESFSKHGKTSYLNLTLVISLSVKKIFFSSIKRVRITLKFVRAVG